jgi:hypothetical protein
MNYLAIIEAAQRYGQHQRASHAALLEYGALCGRGMLWADADHLFEGQLDYVVDALERACYTDAARDLFVVEARLAYYGDHASTLQRQQWRFESASLVQALSDSDRDAA